MVSLCLLSRSMSGILSAIHSFCGCVSFLCVTLIWATAMLFRWVAVMCILVGRVAPFGRLNSLLVRLALCTPYFLLGRTLAPGCPLCLNGIRSTGKRKNLK